MMLSAPMVLVGAWMAWRGLNEPLPPALPAEASAAVKPARKADEPA